MRHGPALLASLLLLSGLASLPTAQAAINQERPYSAPYDYMGELDGPEFIMVSGRIEAAIDNVGGSFGFISSGGAEVSGLTRVCWVLTTRQCADSATGNLRIVVSDVGSFGLRLPPGVEAAVEADHALAMFVDLTGEADLNSLELGRSLLAPLVDGQVTFARIPTIATATTNDPTLANAGILSATDAATNLEVFDGPVLRATLRGKSEPIVFAGDPLVAPVACELAVVPFDGADSVADFRPARKADAKVGLEIGRINTLMDRLYAANEGRPTNSQPIDPAAFGPYESAAAALFRGAVLRVPTQEASGNDVAFARFTELEVAGTSDRQMRWTGEATFEVSEGHVKGARPLYGFSVFQLPWWSWLLWVLALAAWGVRLATRVDKTHATWDRYKWVGWVASPLVFLFVFWLWDLEVRAVLGMSLFSGDAGGQVLLLVAVLEVGTFLAASFAAMAPLRMLLRNGLILLRQGTLMGISGAVASILGFLFVATYLRAYLDVIVSQVLQGIS